MIQPEIRKHPGVSLAGMKRSMSLIQDQTRALWQGFIPASRTIPHRTGNELYSVQIFPSGYFESFSPETLFEKWAAVKVEKNDTIPENMELLKIPEGWYAVFHYRGPAGDPAIFEYIFRQWLPISGFDLDARPHFEILGEKYKNEGPDSEEEIWIPVKEKALASK